LPRRVCQGGSDNSGGDCPSEEPSIHTWLAEESTAVVGAASTVPITAASKSRTSLISLSESFCSICPEQSKNQEASALTKAGVPDAQIEINQSGRQPGASQGNRKKRFIPLAG